MSGRKSFCCFCIAVLSLLSALNANADTATFTFENVFLEDGDRLTGTFVWTYNPGDFEGGSGVFTVLEIPYTAYSLADDNLDISIQSNSIEISGNGDYHDMGLDISLFLAEPLSPTHPAPIDLEMSFFECCGNGFHDQPFSSGGITLSTSPGLETSGLATRFASCADVTSGMQQLFALSGSTYWSCEDAEVFAQDGDTMRLATVGVADGSSPIGATLAHVSPQLASCRNLTTGTTVLVDLTNGGATVDCAAEGLAVTAGDIVVIIGVGLAGSL